MLENGCIPAFTECPFKERCFFLESCYHGGINHSVPFSCGMARAFEITKNSVKE